MLTTDSGARRLILTGSSFGVKRELINDLKLYHELVDALEVLSCWFKPQTA